MAIINEEERRLRNGVQVHLEHRELGWEVLGASWVHHLVRLKRAGHARHVEQAQRVAERLWVCGRKNNIQLNYSVTKLF